MVKIYGEDQIVMVVSSTNTFMYRDIPVSKGNVTGLDPRTGKILWQYTNWECVVSVKGSVVKVLLKTIFQVILGKILSECLTISWRRFTTVFQLNIPFIKLISTEKSISS